MILRKLPAVSNPDELAGFQMPVSYPDYKRYRELHDLFLSTLAYMAPVPFAVIFDGRTERAVPEAIAHHDARLLPGLFVLLIEVPAQ